jgi:hypothetical protein
LLFLSYSFHLKLALSSRRKTDDDDDDDDEDGFENGNHQVDDDEEDEEKVIFDTSLSSHRGRPPLPSSTKVVSYLPRVQNVR